MAESACHHDFSPLSPQLHIANPTLVIDQSANIPGCDNIRLSDLAGQPIQGHDQTQGDQFTDARPINDLKVAGLGV